VQRGNNRQVCFNGDEDMAAYANWLKEFSVKFQVDIHAWVFMTTKGTENIFFDQSTL
jgi:putative transposase